MCKQEWQADVSRVVELEKDMERVKGHLGILPQNDLWERIGRIEERVRGLQEWSGQAGRAMDGRVKDALKKEVQSVRKRCGELVGDVVERVSALEAEVFGEREGKEKGGGAE